VAAIAELADAYFMGRGTKVDLNAAIDCLRKAADTGHAGAQVDLAGQYAFGNGEPRGPDDTPVALLKKAADSGNASALQSLADRYRLGFGVPKDLVKAIELYRRAGDDDDRRLSKGRRTPYWSHDLTAQVLDDKGTPLPQETTELNQFAEIVRIYDLAKDRRDVRAEVRLASLYEQGEVVPHSLVFCYAWYSLAAKQGDKEAEAKLNQLRPRLSGEDMEKVTSFVRGLTVTRFSPDSTQSPNP
jgi:TPR repeat protein